MSISILELLASLESFGVNVVILGIIVMAATSIIKRFVPTKHKKYLTFLPFALGIIFNALYTLTTHGTQQFLQYDTLKYGFESGTVATVCYVVYEQFMRGKGGDIRLATVQNQLGSLILPQFADTETQQILLVADSDGTESEKLEKIVALLDGKTREGVTVADITAAAKLMLHTLAVLKGKQQNKI